MKTKILKFMFVLLLAVPMLAGCGAAAGEPLPFFEGYQWEDLIGMVFALLFGFFPGWKIFEWLKVKFDLEGQAAHYLVLAVSVLLTVAAMFVTGQFDLTGFEFTLGNILENALLIYAASQVAYKRFKEAQAAKIFQAYR